MGTEMTAYIEYDCERYEREWKRKHVVSTPDEQPVDEPPLLPPFSPGNQIESLTWNDGLNTGSKDYLFFGAISGIRNRTGIGPLYMPRGYPPVMSWQIESSIKRNEFDAVYGTGWLTLSEINAALDHQGIDRDYLGTETHVILDIIETLEKRFGKDHVRLVFEF